MNFEHEFHDLLQGTGTSRISSSAYDTAWIVRLEEIDEQLSQKGLAWLLDHQLEDGGWGCEHIVYYHDRFICTLSALLSLTRIGGHASQVTEAAKALTRYASKLTLDPAGATVGFEMIVPTLLAEARDIGLDLRSVTTTPLIQGMHCARKKKLQALRGHKITRLVTPAFSAEMVGTQIDLLDIQSLQDANGSIGCSPSATAFFTLAVQAGDVEALAYLHRMVNDDGGVPYVGPIDVFENAWVPWNLALTGNRSLRESVEPHLDFLEAHWTSEGVASVSYLGFKDGDATSMSFDTLTRFGRNVDIAGVLHYELEDRFQCYPLEADSSTSTNIHALSALHAGGYETEHRAVKKILSFLDRTRTGRLFWFDKWHASPYYATSHAIIALANYPNGLMSDALFWIINTQNPDGSWGFYDIATAEETAYCIQALATSRRHGWQVVNDHTLEEAMRKGKEWLEAHWEEPYPSLWIGKSLYCPMLVVRSAILGALMLIEQEFGR
jgi:halimadienyl-diphosphate synthase